MPDIKPTRQIAEKWGRVTPGRTRDYTAGVENPRRDWEDATSESVEIWERALQEAIALGKYLRGIQKAGTRKWKEKTLQKGPTRWAQGVSFAEDDYSEGFNPYRDLIQSIDLPPRGPRGDPINIERVRVLAEALHALKLEIG